MPHMPHMRIFSHRHPLVGVRCHCVILIDGPVGAAHLQVVVVVQVVLHHHLVVLQLQLLQAGDALHVSGQKQEQAHGMEKQGR
jgi:hypothetical protein